MKGRSVSTGVILAAFAIVPGAAARGFVHPVAWAAAPVPVGAPALAQLSVPGGGLSPALRAARARLVSPALNIWRIAAPASGVISALRAEGVLAGAEPDRRLVPFTHLNSSDPLLPSEWWIRDVGDDQAEPPPAGVPVTVVDTGLDLAHPEFKSRPSTTALNPQTVLSTDDIHGTAVSSVAAAPANGIGLVGVYPQAALQEWDFGDGSLSEILAGLDAVSKRGRGVINFSGGFFSGFDSLLEQGVDRALHRGAIVVAAVGNDRQSGNRSFVPASLPHVLTVGANNEADRVTSFSNRSNALDLVAPGVSIPVAVPTFYDQSGYASFDGTSFSSPLVAGATAWVWTVRPQLDPTQVEDVMRHSARDVGPKGWDADTGFGILSMPAALAEKTPAKDPQEPNDDVKLVRPHAVTASGTRLPTPALLRARLDVTEDPEDVYRVWVPAHARIAASTKSAANVNLGLWGPRTRTVYERGSALRRDLVAYSQRSGSRPDVVSGRNSTRVGSFYYVDAFLGKRVGGAAYSLKVSVSRR